MKYTEVIIFINLTEDCMINIMVIWMKCYNLVQEYPLHLRILLFLVSRHVV